MLRSAEFPRKLKNGGRCWKNWGSKSNMDATKYSLCLWYVSRRNRTGALKRWRRRRDEYGDAGQRIRGVLFMLLVDGL